jgi:arsenate reductase
MNKVSTNKITIYHNPRCSKSRKALEILQGKSLEFDVIEYLKHPLNLEQLIKLRSSIDLNDLVRTSEPVFKERGLSLNDEQQILNAMVQEPILMQRPIVLYKKKAIVARPPEKLLELIGQ